VPLSRSRDYLSIGEVLDSIKAEFPDVSISKIRFLESEGLIAPERTPSGYRKFYEDDVRRLKYILALQRDQFMPLKVIRERLAQVDSNGGKYPAASEVPPARAASAPVGAAPAPKTDVSLDRSELLRASGLTEQQLAGLIEYGVLSDDGTFRGSDMELATAARRLFEYGLEPRHLRMFRQMADREVAFIEQLTSPIRRRTQPQAKTEAASAAAELAGLTRRVREALLRSALDQLL
jgi:DNA-binding transcriptional MerR regulator